MGIIGKNVFFLEQLLDNLRDVEFQDKLSQLCSPINLFTP